MIRTTHAFSATVVPFALCLIWSGSAAAYDRYSVAGDSTNCRACHGDFTRGGYTSSVDGSAMGNLHDLHRTTMLGGDCNTCHTSGGRIPVRTASSNGGAGLAAISCLGCHGRAEDNVMANPEVAMGGSGYGAGLRQHHYRAGQTICATCHADANPTGYTPVGENVLPPYYSMPGTGHPMMPTLPCNPASEEDFAGSTIGIDNDGDDVYDMLDTDCTPALPIGSACTMASSCASGFCADGFCCDTACGAGAAADCLACAHALTGVADGTCGNVTAAAAIVCRASAGACDVAESCSGTSDTCPADAFAAAATVCRAAAATCDVAETCSGTDATCPADALAADGAACSDGLMCNEGEICTAGACGGGMVADCDDMDPCTTDSCAEPAGCAHVGIAGCVDAGPPDAGMTASDGGGMPGSDAGVSAGDGSAPGADGGSAPPPADDGGCGCVAVGTRSTHGRAGGLLALLGLAVVASRRRRRR